MRAKVRLRLVWILPIARATATENGASPVDLPRGLPLQLSLRGASVPRSVTGDSRGGAAASIRQGDGALMDGTRIGRRAFLAAGGPLGLGAPGLAAPGPGEGPPTLTPR